jgi:hypothetical protein
MPGLRVCVDCYDPIHPQEFLQDTADPQGLWQPSPEYGPAGPTLTVTQNASDNLLNWTKADPRGGALISNYSVFRAASYDGGLTFGEPAQLYNVVVQYDSFGLLLYDPDHPVDYQPDVPPGTIIVDPYTFDDTTIEAGVTYEYYVAAYFTKRRFVPSNYVVTATEIVVEYLTSRPYPYDFSDPIELGFVQLSSEVYLDFDQMNVGFAFEAGSLQTVLVTYGNYAPEPINVGFTFESGSVPTVLIDYGNYAPEPVNTSFNFESGSVVNALITYGNYVPEPVNVGFLFTAGSLT